MSETKTARAQCVPHSDVLLSQRCLYDRLSSVWNAKNCRRYSNLIWASGGHKPSIFHARHGVISYFRSPIDWFDVCKVQLCSNHSTYLLTVSESSSQARPFISCKCETVETCYSTKMDCEITMWAKSMKCGHLVTIPTSFIPETTSPATSDRLEGTWKM